MTIRAVLFDVGGPIATEIEHERAIDADIRSLFAEAGMPISDGQYAAAWREVIDEFSPNAYSAVIYKLAAGDEEIAPSVWRGRRGAVTSAALSSSVTASRSCLQN